MKKVLVWAILLFITGLFVAQVCFVFPGATINKKTPFYQPGGEAEFDSSDKLINTSRGWIRNIFIQSQSKDLSLPLIVYFHNKNDLIDSNAEKLKFFSKQGFNVLLVEYPGYGDSSGFPNLKNILITQYESIQEKSHIQQKIIFWGSGFGANVALNMSNFFNVDTIILDSMKNKISDNIKNYALAKLYDLSPIYQYNNEERLKFYKNKKTKFILLKKQNFLSQRQFHEIYSTIKRKNRIKIIQLKKNTCTYKDLEYIAKSINNRTTYI